jgi:RNA polymerase sigma factor (sigma-70 family)
MNPVTPTAPPGANSELLTQTRAYLLHRKRGLPPSYPLEIAWRDFYDVYSQKIRVFAFKCGAADEEIVDCVQEVWRELLVRLPTFHLDLSRGRFDTWLYQIVRGKAADLHRSHKRRFFLGNADTLQTVRDTRPSPDRAMEEEELATVAWDQLKRRLSECNFQVLKMRLVEQRPVAEVAEKLGLSNEQVWYRYHRARRELEVIGSALVRGKRSPQPVEHTPCEKTKKNQEFAQGKRASSVSRRDCPSSLADQGGNCVDYVFQKMELGRRELNPEWKVEWNCDAEPRPVLYIRKTAIVAYAEMCGHGDFINAHWPRIVNAAIAAGVAAGIATIIATPTAALPIFQTEFHKQLQGKGGSAAEENMQVALSAKLEANGPWCICKD